MVSSQWSVVSGQWSVVSSQWSVVLKQLTTDNSQRTIHNGQLKIKPIFQLLTQPNREHVDCNPTHCHTMP